jgi:type IV pilus assembly protein PilW
VKPRLTRRFGARGFSVVELMIAVTVGLLLLVAISQFFLSGKQAYRRTDDTSKMEDNARYALHVMNRTLRQTGYKFYDPANVQLPFESVFPAGQPEMRGLNQSGVNSSDQISVQFYGSNDSAGTPDGSIVDCQGNAIGFGVLSTNTFYVKNTTVNGVNVPALFCDTTDLLALPAGGATGGVALALDVEDFQVLYGVDTDGDYVPNRFLPAGSAGLTMSQVVSVRIALLMRTSGRVAGTQTTADISLFGASYPAAAAAADLGSVFTPAADSRVRRVFDSTVTLRNRVQ